MVCVLAFAMDADAVNENIFNSTTAFPSGRAQKNSEKNQQVVFSLDALMLISQTIT